MAVIRGAKHDASAAESKIVAIEGGGHRYILRGLTSRREARYENIDGDWHEFDYNHLDTAVKYRAPMGQWEVVARSSSIEASYLKDYATDLAVIALTIDGVLCRCGVNSFYSSEGRFVGAVKLKREAYHTREEALNYFGVNYRGPEPKMAQKFIAAILASESKD